ncbi:hypothetical protein BDV19DRAFT_389563 [Aspergillus venezuelensis]
MESIAEDGRVSPNCRFEIGDYELPWNFPHTFDYIHMRGIEGSVKDFHRLFEQAHQNLNTGGWFEMCDFTVGVFSDDESAQKATNKQRWHDLLVEASQKFGKEFSVAKNYKQWMIDAGFKNDMGKYHQSNMLEALEAYSLALMTRFLGWSVENAQVLLKGVQKELTDRTLHIYSRVYVVYGQKE